MLHNAWPLSLSSSKTNIAVHNNVSGSHVPANVHRSLRHTISLNTTTAQMPGMYTNAHTHIPKAYAFFSETNHRFKSVNRILMMAEPVRTLTYEYKYIYSHTRLLRRFERDVLSMCILCVRMCAHVR